MILPKIGKFWKKPEPEPEPNKAPAPPSYLHTQTILLAYSDGTTDTLEFHTNTTSHKLPPSSHMRFNNKLWSIMPTLQFGRLLAIECTENCRESEENCRTLEEN